MSPSAARRSAENHSRFAELVSNDPMGRADTDMSYVLGALPELGAIKLQHLTPQDARRQPGLSAAIAHRLAIQGRTAAEDDGILIEDIVIPGPAGDIPARVYRTELRGYGTPMILYIHGGGWVVGDLDNADASPRALAKKTGAIVVSTHYRLAPEHKFPAAHDDTQAAWAWMIDNGRKLGGDPRNAAVVGEGVGGNMAFNIGVETRTSLRLRPVHQVLIHPVAGTDMSRPSYVSNMRAKPLDTFLMQWFVRQTFAGKDDAADPRIDLANRTDLSGLPETTIILAEIDPLTSEGEALGAALEAAGVAVDVTTYEGVTHGFFGLARFVTKAMFAQSHVAANLRAAFDRRRPS